MSRFVNNIKKKWLHLRLRPIHVYCLHHVCEQYDAESMHEEDWMALSEFKQKVLAMQQSGVHFISLSDAHNILAYSLSPLAFRLKRYAVLTFDDGYASLKEVLPWLREQNIPCTLFINGKYLDGKSYRESPKEQYLTEEDLRNLLASSPSRLVAQSPPRLLASLPSRPIAQSPLITIGHHGWEHTDACKMDESTAIDSVEKNVAALSSLPNYIPFWAYTWGHYGKYIQIELNMRKIIPVFVDGQFNYQGAGCIHREILK